MFCYGSNYTQRHISSSYLSTGDIGSATASFDLSRLHFLYIKTAIMATMTMADTIPAVTMPAIPVATIFPAVDDALAASIHVAPKSRMFASSDCVIIVDAAVFVVWH